MSKFTIHLTIDHDDIMEVWRLAGKIVDELRYNQEVEFKRHMVIKHNQEA